MLTQYTQLKHSLVILLIAVFAGLSSASLNANDFTGASDLKWFNDLNWSEGHIPLSSEDAVIAGFDVVAYTGDGVELQCSDLDIAHYETPGTASLYTELPINASWLGIGGSRTYSGHHHGTLTVVGADVTLSSGIRLATSSADATDSAEGHISITDGSLYLGDSIDMGYIFQGGGNSTATLSVINGDIHGSTDDGIYLGYNVQSSPGFADGSLYIENGRMDELYEAYFGYASSSTGGAIGKVTLLNSEAYIIYDLVFADGSNCSALLTLDNAYIETGYLYFGEETTTQFHIDGTQRVSGGNVSGPDQYSAIDMSDIYGSSYGVDIEPGARLEAHFGFTPTIGDTFDLIRLNPGQTFTGIFTEVVDFGLDPSLGTYYEIIPGDAQNGAILRLTITEAPSLVADHSELSADTGGTINFSLDAGTSNAGRKYLVLGSLSGTSPGIVLPGGFETLPIAWDGFTDLVFAFLNTPVFSNFLNVLDANGESTAQLNAPALDPIYVGSQMSYAFCLNNPFDYASNPVHVHVVP